MTNVKITNEAFRLKYNLDGVQPPALDGLVCARNDSAAFQIVLQSDSQYSVNVGTAEWFSRKLHLRGPHERLRVAVKAPFETEVCLEGMMTDQDDIEKTDLLLAQDVIECKGNLPSAVWAEVKVPKDATAGEYAVTVTVFRSGYGEDEEIILSEQIPLTVAEYVLPDPKDWKFYLNLWQHRRAHSSVQTGSGRILLRHREGGEGHRRLGTEIHHPLRRRNSLGRTGLHRRSGAPQQSVRILHRPHHQKSRRHLFV